MVGEFPELQGIMGGYYARAEGLGDAIADAVRDHYKPQGPSDTVPTAPVTVAVALADKLDTLTGFFAIDEKPTGSKDPYALRRAALGVIRLVLDNGLRLGLRQFARRGPAGLLRRPPEGRPARRRASGTTSSTPCSRSAMTTWSACVARVEALSSFLGSEDGANLLAGYKRASNILKAEQKKELRRRIL